MIDVFFVSGRICIIISSFERNLNYINLPLIWNQISRFSCFEWQRSTNNKVEKQKKKNDKNVQYSLKKEQCVRGLIRWIFNQFIVPLLSTCFYITETSGAHKNKTMYYRKPVWHILRRLGMQPLLGSLFTPLSKVSVDKAFANEKCIGVHAIRLLPAQKKVNYSRCTFFRNFWNIYYNSVNLWLERYIGI